MYSKLKIFRHRQLNDVYFWGFFHPNASQQEYHHSSELMKATWWLTS